MWFRGAERGLLFTAGQTNRISNSGTLSWEGHGSDPIITQTWVLGEVKAGVYFFFSQSLYGGSCRTPIHFTSSLLEHHRSVSSDLQGPRKQGLFAPLPRFSFFLFYSLYLILPIQMQQGAAAGALLGYITSCAANNSLATSGLYANWTGDPTVPTPNPHHHRRHHLFRTTLTLCNLGNLGAKRMLLGKRRRRKRCSSAL